LRDKWHARAVSRVSLPLTTITRQRLHKGVKHDILYINKVVINGIASVDSKQREREIGCCAAGLLIFPGERPPGPEMAVVPLGCA